jgi:hypothetical protein
MPNFHFLVPLLGLSEVAYRSLIWAIHLPIPQEEFLNLLTIRYFKTSLDGWSLTLNLRVKEGSKLSSDIYGDYQSYFRLPLPMIEDDGTLPKPHELRLNSKHANRCLRWYSCGKSDYFYVNTLCSRIDGPENQICREEFFARCYELGITN